MTGLHVDIEAQVGAFELRVAFHTDVPYTALLGPSGAGKTLTLRAVAGLLRPVKGRVRLAGRALLDSAVGLDLPARSRRVGYLFQQYALFPHLDVWGNVAFGLGGLDRPTRDARTAELIELVGLRGRERARPGELSGGQQQRVALARTLAPRPDLLLLDEPFAALDPTLRRRMRALVAEVREAVGVPVVLVSHDPEDAALAGRVLTLEAGRVVEAAGASLAIAR